MPSLFLASSAHTLPLYTAAQLRTIEQHAMRDLPAHTLMQRAGTAAADFLARRYSAGDTPQQRVIWLAAGPGNNGGDALVAATELHRRGIPVEVFLPVESRPADACWALANAQSAGVKISPQWDGSCDGHAYDWCVDGMFGLGYARPLEGVFAAVAQQLALRTRNGGKVLALDIPSGLNGDTGAVARGAHAVAASATLSFIGAQPGLYTADGKDACGSVWIAPLGLSMDIGAALDTGVDTNIGTDVSTKTGTADASPHPLWLNTLSVFKPSLPPRINASNKGTFGSLAVVGGATGTVGAPILSARAALYAGAGKVHVALLSEQAPPYDPPHPELMLHPGTAMPQWAGISAVAVGPGMGQDAHAKDLLVQIIEQELPTVLDADALNLIASEDSLATLVVAHGRRAVMTPHPLECARLLKTDTAAIQSDRLKAARSLARHYGCVAVLKGSGTIVARPDGVAWINPTGNAALATGGTGDVLSGLIGAFLAQGCEPHMAALAAVFLHGLAAEQLCTLGCGPAGLTAGELAPMVRTLLNRLCYTAPDRDLSGD